MKCGRWGRTAALGLMWGGLGLLGLTQGAWAQAPAAPRPAVAGGAVAPARPAAADNIRVLLTPAQETTLSSPVAGRILALNASLGSSFTAGQVLVQFDCDEPVARQKMARAELTGAVEQHEAKLRMQGLEQASDVEVSLAASVVAKAKAQVDLYAFQISQCRILAPWPGRVAKLHARQHMSVTPGQPLLELVGAGRLKLRLNIPSRWLSQIATGHSFEVAIDETGKRYQAVINRMNGRVDSVSQTIEVEATLADAFPELLPGMSGTALFSAKR